MTGGFCIIAGGMKTALTALTLLLGLLTMAADALAQSAPAHAPIITRPVAADFAAETFTLFWRPPTLNANAVTEYRIYREQNAAADRDPTAHPTHCDTVDFSVRLTAHTFTVSLAHPQVHQYTVSPRGTGQPGITHGNCYRWQIAAANQNGAGPTAATQPILARGFVLNATVFSYDHTRNAQGEQCPAATFRPYAYNANGWGGVCIAREHIGRAEECHSLRPRPEIAAASYPTENNDAALCVINLGTNTATDMFCQNLGYSDNGFDNNREHCVMPQRCQTLQEFNLDHRQCLCRGWATPKSSGTGCECTVTGANANCECPAGTTYDPETNSCGCPAGQEFVSGLNACHAVCPAGQTRVTSASLSNTGCFPDELIPILEDCEDKGWVGRESHTAFLSLGELACQIPSVLYARYSSTSEFGCFIQRQSISTAPPCTGMFGDPPVFPNVADHPGVTTDGFTPGGDVFVANCDRDGAVPGGSPPDISDGSYECTCGEGYAGTWPNCTQLTPELICGRQGWAYDSGTGKCRIPLTSGGTDYDGCFLSGGGAPQCADVFGEGLEIPAKLTGLALTLFNGFDSRKDTIIPYVAEGARVWRDAAAARHNGEEDYDVALLANYDGNAKIENRLIIATLSPVFIENGISFGADGSDTAAGRATLAAAFEMIPVRGAFVFNCGAGATPSGANTLSATECECGGAFPIRRGRGVCAADCPDGMVAVEGECLEATAANKCRAGGWESEGGLCVISVADFHSNTSTMTMAALFNQCALGESEFLPECAEVFGADLDFPRKPPGEIPRYPFNCDADGTRGLVPATMNRANAEGQWTTEECMCADSTGVRKGAVSLASGGGYAPMVGGRCEVCAADEFRDGEDCVEACPAGEVTLGRECLTPGEKCEARGWESISSLNRCIVGYWDLSSEVLKTGGSCTYSSGGSCQEAFGPNLDFPKKPADGGAPRYIYNCDPDGTRGLIPATINTVGLIGECQCANPERTRQGAAPSSNSVNGLTPLVGGQCVCPAGKVGSADGLSCVCPADKVAEGDGCGCPSGTEDLQGYCVSVSEKADAEKCTEAGWDFADGMCAVPVSTGGTVSAGCGIASGAGEVSCAEVFGSGGALSFPAMPGSLFAVAAYVYDCAGGASPSGANENGETTCACPGGMVYVEGECVEGTAENKCRAAGWEFKLTLGGQLKTCLIRSANALVTDNAASRFSSEFCSIDENGIVGEGTCYTDFGPDLNFPVRPADGSFPHYAFNCGWAGGSVAANNGLLPRQYADGATDCYCEDSTAVRFDATEVDDGAGAVLRYDGVCLSGEAAQGAEACEGAGWSLTSGGAEGWQCAIPVMRGTTAAKAGCFVSGTGEPECSDVFGSGFAFPATTGTAVTFVFECGEKMVPAGVNLTGATACECAATGSGGECVCGGGKVDDGAGGCECPGTHYDFGDVCVPNAETNEDFDGFSQEELCVAFGGRVLDEGGGKVCAGLDLEGTFCVLDAGEEGAFPCRGMFKHLRRCNGVWNRPGVNVFLCGGVCEDGRRARGGGCL